MVMAQSIPSVQITPGYLSVICHLGGPSSREFVRKPLPGVGHLSFLLEAVNIVPLLIFHLKICPFG